MASNIDAIISAIVSLNVQLSGSSVLVRSGTTLKDSEEISDLPTRIVSPVGMTSQRTRVQTLGGAGHVMSTEWTITDTCLLRAVGMGLGLTDIATVYQAYMAAYIEQARQLSNQTYTLTLLTQRAQVVEFAVGSGRNYHAVICTLTFVEIVQ